MGLVFVLEALDNTVRTPEQAPGNFWIALAGNDSAWFEDGNSVGGNKPRLAAGSSKEAVELVTQVRPQSKMAESYRALRTSLLLTSAGTPPKVIFGNKRFAPGRQDYDEYQLRGGVGAEGIACSFDRRRPSPPRSPQDFGDGSVRGTEQCTYRQHRVAAGDHAVHNFAVAIYNSRGNAPAESGRTTGVHEHARHSGGIAS